MVKCEQFIDIGCSVSGSRVARQRGRFRGTQAAAKGREFCSMSVYVNKVETEFTEWFAPCIMTTNIFQTNLFEG